MRRSLALGLVAVLLPLAGCAEPPASPVQPPAPVAEEWPAATHALTGCEAPPFAPFPCFEPTIASDSAGRLFVVPGSGDRLVRSDDGGKTWTEASVPAPPAGMPSSYGPGDAVVQADEADRLWWSAIVYDHEGRTGQMLGGLQVARSDDHGATWTVDHFFDLSRHPAGVSFVDRQWLASWVGGAAILFWSVEVGSWISQSGDDGATWSDFQYAMPVALRANPNIPGSLVRGTDGALYFGFATGAGPANEMRVARWRPESAVAEQFTVHRAESDSYGSWPTLVSHNGTLTIAWTTGSGAVLVSTSKDGSSWSAPVAWSGGRAAGLPPGLAVRDGAVTVSWYSKGSALWAVGPAADAPGAVRELASGLGSDRTTDFATATAWPHGEAVAWIHPKDGVSVAVHVAA